MNKYLGIASLVLFVIIVSILGFFFHKTILDVLISIDVTKFNFLIVYLLICSIYFLFPLPVFFIILLNGYLFQNIGFYISYCLYRYILVPPISPLLAAAAAAAVVHTKKWSNYSD